MTLLKNHPIGKIVMSSIIEEAVMMPRWNKRSALSTITAVEVNETESVFMPSLPNFVPTNSSTNRAKNGCSDYRCPDTRIHNGSSDDSRTTNTIIEYRSIF